MAHNFGNAYQIITVPASKDNEKTQRAKEEIACGQTSPICFIALHAKEQIKVKK